MLLHVFLLKSKLIGFQNVNDMAYFRLNTTIFFFAYFELNAYNFIFIDF
jgi:hypothetical protein